MRLFSSRLKIAATICGVILASWVSRSSAQDAGSCEEEPRSDFEFFPADGSSNVALDAPIRIRLPAYFDPSSSIAVFAGESAIPGTISYLGDTALFMPTALWNPETQYDVRIGGEGEAREFSFTSGSDVDSGPPDFMFDERTLATSIQRTDSNCEDHAARLDVAFEPATDDSAPGDIEYILYVTRANGLEAPSARARIRNTPGQVVMSLFLGAEEATSPVCLAVVAVDGVGNTAAEQRAVCFDPFEGAYFDGVCTAGISARRTALGMPALFLVCAALALIRRRSCRKR